MLLANIAYAKRNGINKIVIPNPREIAKQRTDSFDEILGSDEQLFKAYEEASKKKVLIKMSLQQIIMKKFLLLYIKMQ